MFAMIFARGSLRWKFKQWTRRIFIYNPMYRLCY